MINVWLKIRNRPFENQGERFVLKHLEFWLAVFNDQSKYKIWIYNEDFKIPNNFKYKLKNIPILNREKLLLNKNCKFINDEIKKENILSEWWKPTAFALAAPYFYFSHPDQYIFNIDADDLILEGPAIKYIEKAYNFAVENKLETFSYDILYSKNGFSTDQPNVWTFGLNISSTSKMRNIILSNLKNKSIIGQGEVGLNLDLLINYHTKLINNYVSFITPDNLVHMEINSTKFDKEKNKVEVLHHGTISYVDLPAKLKLIEL